MTAPATFLLVVLISVPASAHGDADWILKTRWSACCGITDCFPVAAVFTSDGWQFRVPKSEATALVREGEELPSENDHFWACVTPTEDGYQIRQVFDPVIGRQRPCVFRPRPQI